MHFRLCLPRENAKVPRVYAAVAPRKIYHAFDIAFFKDGIVWINHGPGTSVIGNGIRRTETVSPVALSSNGIEI